MDPVPPGSSLEVEPVEQCCGVIMFARAHARVCVCCICTYIHECAHPSALCLHVLSPVCRYIVVCSFVFLTSRYMCVTHVCTQLLPNSFDPTVPSLPPSSLLVHCRGGSLSILSLSSVQESSYGKKDTLPMLTRRTLKMRCVPVRGWGG